MLLGIRQSIDFFESSQSFPVCPSENSSIKMKNGMEHWWNDTDRGETEVFGEKSLALPLCSPQIWPEIEEPATKRLSHVMALNFATIDLTVCEDSIGTAHRTHPASTRKTETAFVSFECEECCAVRN